MRRKYALLKWRFTRWLLSHPRVATYVAKRAKLRHIKDSLEFGMLKACASPKDSADLARGTAWVLRNELGQPITKVTLAKPWNTEDKCFPDITLWERIDDGIPDELVIALRGKALRAGKHPSVYGLGVTA